MPISGCSPRVALCWGMWRFEVFKDDDRGWRWRLVQRNTVIVFESLESFGRRGDAKRAAEKAREEISASLVEAV